MNIKALITSIVVLGSSSLALADSHYAGNYSGGVEVRGTVDVRDHRYEPAPAPMPVPAPVTTHWRKPMLPQFQILSSSDSIGRNGRETIRLSSQLQTLKLQATSGKTSVTQVAIKFANGRTQLVYPNQVLDMRNPSLTIDLQGNGFRNVVGITIFGSSSRRSTFEVLGA